MFRVSFFFLVLSFMCQTSTALAQNARVNFTSRLKPVSTAFLAANQVDLSKHSTWARSQWPTGNCVGFSHVAAMEARFNHKYCEPRTNNAFRADGYCKRYDAVTAAYPYDFYFNVRYPDWTDGIFLPGLKEVDLSEHYYLSRTFTQMTTQGAATHETGTMFNFSDGFHPDYAGTIANMHLPEEPTAPFINNAEFYAASGPGAIAGWFANSTFTQRTVDVAEFGPTLSALVTGPAAMRPNISVGARANARFAISELFNGRVSDLGTLVQRQEFLERALYSGYEVALHGAYPGHSMLLVGYDRTKCRFMFKDHYMNWTTVDYDTALNAGSYTIVTDVTYEASGAAEEMWLGKWTLDSDGRVGTLTIHRTRQPTNTVFSVSAGMFYDQNLDEMPKDKWARIGTYQADGSTTLSNVFGRLGADGDDRTMEMYIVANASDPRATDRPSTLEQHVAGFPPPASAQIIRLTMAGSTLSAMYATGDTTWGNQSYGVLLRRADNPAGLPTFANIPRSSFARSAWANRYFVYFEDGTVATVSLSAPASGAPTGSISYRGEYCILAGWLYQENAMLVYPTTSVSNTRASSLQLRYHTWETGILSGLDGNGRPIFAIRG